MTVFWCANGPAPTTAAFASVTTGTAIKTMLQVKPGANNSIKLKGWGISFDGTAANTPIKCELLTTDVAATVTAHVAAGVQPYQTHVALGGSVPASTVSLGTTSTGYTSTSEGSITATKHHDLQFIPPTNQYVFLWPLGDEPVIPAAGFLRVRVTAGTAVNCYTWVRWEE